MCVNTFAWSRYTSMTVMNTVPANEATRYPPVDLFGSPMRAPKHFFDGTYRTVAPEQTMARIRPLFRKVGITRLADVTGLDRIPVSTVIAMRPNSRTLANGSGKGFTKLTACVSAAMETIEHYCAEQSNVSWVTATWNELSATDQVVAVDNLQLNKHALFSVDLPEKWTPGWDIVSCKEVFVPLLSVDMAPRHRTRSTELTSFQMGSNGLASGNAQLEAIASGLYEAIERDATTSWHVATNETGLRPPRVRLDTIDSELPRDLLERLNAAAIELVLEDCTIDTAVPVYMATIHDARSNLGFFCGYGAHLDPSIAMIRAITEAVQARVVYVAGARDDVFDHRRHLMKRREHALVYETIEGNPETLDASSLHSEAPDTFEGEIAVLVEKLNSVGLDQVIVIDLTRPELDVPVVKVVVPGLEGYKFAFYTPGRRALAFVNRIREHQDTGSPEAIS